ncbi:Thioredoxin [Actinacidiphila alni]|uniref:Thioredoxin n=1 Tax=Actinacidiphila alni TaxID=380248 RepID=A0A1I2CBP7_9ACTN|nr:DsbA family protein [Actinacidiphila alni]SFE65777.1 Thioredoxin [Actinacidiphila alni]
MDQPSSAASRPPVLEVWCELQCPDCRSALDDVRALREKYGDALDIQLRHFPLPKHAHALAAAQAYEEAYAQGSGWPYAEAVLARVEELDRRGEAVLVEVARELGLDADEVDTALIDGRHLLVVDSDEAEGKAIGVTGTPTYVIGGERLDGGKSQEGLRERIVAIADRLLSGSGAAAPAPVGDASQVCEVPRRKP